MSSGPPDVQCCIGPRDAECIDDGKHESAFMKVLSRAGRCQSPSCASVFSDTLPANAALPRSLRSVRVQT